MHLFWKERRGTISLKAKACSPWKFGDVASVPRAFLFPRDLQHGFSCEHAAESRMWWTRGSVGSLLGSTVRAGVAVQKRLLQSFLRVTGWYRGFFLFSLVCRKGPEPGCNGQERQLLLNAQILQACCSGVLHVWKTGKLPPLQVKGVSLVLTSRNKSSKC